MIACTYPITVLITFFVASTWWFVMVLLWRSK